MRSSIVMPCRTLPAFDSRCMKVITQKLQKSNYYYIGKTGTSPKKPIVWTINGRWLFTFTDGGYSANEICRRIGRCNFLRGFVVGAWGQKFSGECDDGARQRLRWSVVDAGISGTKALRLCRDLTESVRLHPARCVAQIYLESFVENKIMFKRTQSLSLYLYILQ